MLDQKFINKLVVSCRYRKKSPVRFDDHPGGWAYYNSHRMELTFVKEAKCNKIALAHVIAHELAHCQGLKHGQMKGPRYSYKPGWEEYWRWTEALTLERQKIYMPVEKTALTKAQDKLANAQTLLKQWETKKKMAMNKVSKYKEQSKYYAQRVEELGKATS